MRGTLRVVGELPSPSRSIRLSVPQQGLRTRTVAGSSWAWEVCFVRASICNLMWECEDVYVRICVCCTSTRMRVCKLSCWCVLCMRVSVHVCKYDCWQCWIYICMYVLVFVCEIDCLHVSGCIFAGFGVSGWPFQWQSLGPSTASFKVSSSGVVSCACCV